MNSSFIILLLLVLVGFFLLAAILLVPVYLFLKKEKKRSEAWTHEAITQRMREAASDSSESAAQRKTNGQPPNA